MLGEAPADPLLDPPMNVQRHDFVAGTNSIPIRFHVAGAGLFDLLSLDVENYFRTWTIQSSSGAVFNVTGDSTLNFSDDPEWQGISYFEIVHDPGEPNGFIQVDNIRVEFVPEPFPGDFNHDGIVDAADYSVWRDGLGRQFTQDDYADWKSNFGAVAGSGSHAASAVPEPMTLVFVALAGFASLAIRRR